MNLPNLPVISHNHIRIKKGLKFLSSRLLLIKFIYDLIMIVNYVWVKYEIGFSNQI